MRIYSDLDKMLRPASDTRTFVKTIFRHKIVRRVTSIFILVFMDFVALGIGLAGAVLVSGGDVAFAFYPAPVFLTVWVLTFAAFRLYALAPSRRNPGALVAAASVWAGISFAGVAFYSGSVFGAGRVVFAAGVGLGLAAIFRVVFETGVEGIFRRGIGRDPILVVGGEEGRNRLRKILSDVPTSHEVVSEMDFVQTEDGKTTVDLRRLRSVLDSGSVGSVFLVEAERLPDDEFLTLLESVRLRGVPLRVLPGALSLMNGRQRIYSGVGVPLLDVSYPALDNTQRTLKRAMDVGGSLAGLVFLSPLLLAVAAAIRLTSSGPALYGQKRAGADERVFVCYKFRSMYADSDERQAALEAENDADDVVFKMRRDPRVTPLGRFLRRWSIDEVPQLINVLKGEMSLVGPRPLPLRDFERLEERHRGRLAALPGMTGYWQVTGRSDLPFEEMVRLDLYYIENWSLAFDARIILKTLGAVVRGEGAY